VRRINVSGRTLLLVPSSLFFSPPRKLISRYHDVNCCSWCSVGGEPNAPVDAQSPFFSLKPSTLFLLPFFFSLSPPFFSPKMERNNRRHIARNLQDDTLQAIRYLASMFTVVSQPTPHASLPYVSAPPPTTFFLPFPPLSFFFPTSLSVWELSMGEK